MPNRDQRRRDGTFEYAQLDLAPASDEPAQCGDRCPSLVGGPAFCCVLTAGHVGWHEAETEGNGYPPMHWLTPDDADGSPMTRPDATLDQLRTLIDLANAQHLHDAEQWLRERVEAAEERMGVRRDV